MWLVFKCPLLAGFDCPLTWENRPSNHWILTAFDIEEKKGRR
jgi:hypothetical protein